MKIFFYTFVVTFILLLSGFYAIEHYISIEIARENADIASFTSQLPITDKAGATDDFGLPDNATTSDSSVVQLPPHPAAPSDLASTPESLDGPASDSASALAEPTQPTPENTEICRQLLAMGYNFDRAAFFGAITRDDQAAIELFLKAGMPLEPPIAFSYEPAADSPYLFYASQTTMLYNPLSLAIVASAGKSLPLLLSAASTQKRLLELNEITCVDRRKIDRWGYDLLGIAIQSGDINLLRNLISAGLQPVQQSYLLVALMSRPRVAKGELSPEVRRQIFRQRADLMVELINAGQNVEQRIPTPFPVPPAMEMFFSLAGKEIRDDLIARVNSESARKKLQVFADRLDRRR
ncbi:MAG TPA: hypothetical protein PLM07_21130 [Candidatus Rifleibacterium sp.]|nr:hypothetical protein [Candidatus Rifleibacterium sp.]HPT48396.1 hypothetical protein [Candidatus Rifleibacterium sp.]